MKKEWQVALGATVFLGVLFLVYWFWSYEDAGSVMILFSGCAYAIICGFFLLQWLRRKRIPRPEDRPEANQEDGAGEISFFPSNSIWPGGMGLGAILVGLGLVFGTWYIALGGAIFLGAVIGFVVEAEAGAEAMDELEERIAAEKAAEEAAAEEHRHTDA